MYELNRIFGYDIIRNNKSTIMKTIIFPTSPYFKCLVIAAVVFSSMAFRNPFLTQHQTKNVQIMDTIPDTDIHINIDVNSILAEVDKALASINFDKIMADVQLSLEKINVEKIQQQVEQSLKQIDFEKMQKDIDASLKSIDWKKINKNLDSSMNRIN
jgi:hypothetical protein